MHSSAPPHSHAFFLRLGFKISDLGNWYDLALFCNTNNLFLFQANPLIQLLQNRQSWRVRSFRTWKIRQPQIGWPNSEENWSAQSASRPSQTPQCLSVKTSMQCVPPATPDSKLRTKHVHSAEANWPTKGIWWWKAFWTLFQRKSASTSVTSKKLTLNLSKSMKNIAWPNLFHAVVARKRFLWGIFLNTSWKITTQGEIPKWNLRTLRTRPL